MIGALIWARWVLGALWGPVVPPLVWPQGGIAFVTSDRAGVFGGVDTHNRVCVAAAVDGAGRVLGAAEFVAGVEGCGWLAGWAQCWGPVLRGGDGAVVAESASGCVEAIRAVAVARRSAVKARTVAPNQINAAAVVAPEGLQDRLKGAHNL